MNASLTPITAILMPTASTQTGASHVLANQASVALESVNIPVVVRKDPAILKIYSNIKSYLVSIFYVYLLHLQM